MRHRSFVSFFIFVVATLPVFKLPSSAFAVQPKAISYDTPVVGQITDATLTESWQLTAPGKDVISISVQRTQDTLVPEFQVLDSNGKVVAGATHDETYSQAVIPSVQLPAPGVYTITVGRYKVDAGKTSGQYKLNVALLGAGPDRPDVYSSGGLFPENTWSGTLSNEHWGMIFGFDTKHGKEHIRFVAKRDITCKSGVCGTLIPTISLLDGKKGASSPNYNGSRNQLIADSPSIAKGDLSPDGTTATLDVNLPDGEGFYLILVERKDKEQGTTQGNFTLSIDLVAASAQELSERSIGLVELGRPTSGELSGFWQEKYALRIERPAPITITVKRKSGTLIPAIKISDEKGTLLKSAEADDTFAQASITNFTPPAPGIYMITVLREGEERGATWGEFDLTVSPSTS